MNIWYMHNPASALDNDTYKLLSDFDIKPDHQASRPYNNQRKKILCLMMDLAFLADHKIKFKENEMKDNYLILSRKLKTLWNRKVTTISIVNSALGQSQKDYYRNWRSWR